ncbi:MAG: sugar transferase [Candidatus Adiutrix sp.]|jgi:exopolysaccharide biosynthesis polyprenyl glycosylphosphotransferase|nr:sugar transferase [Candidatus Adiutrix sp.]
MRISPDNQAWLKFAASLGQWAALVGLWLWVWLNYYAEGIFRSRGNILVVAVYGFLLFFFTRFYGGYQIWPGRKWTTAFSCLLALVLTNFVTYLQSSLIGRSLADPVPLFFMTGLQTLLIAAWSWGAGYVFQCLVPPRRLMLIHGDEEAAAALTKKMLAHRKLYVIEESLSAEAGLEEILSRLGKYRAVIMCELPAKIRNGVLNYCFDRSIRVYVVPMVSDILMRGAADLHLFDTPLLMSANQGLNFMQRLVKRGLDLVLASLGLVLTSPLMLLTAAAIKLYDGGPVFFYQERCTVNNRVFNIRKFRSMVLDAEKDGRPRPATDGDRRITPVGRVIRRLRIDELPQLFNILKGDMSLVGPRPERLENIREYTAKHPEFSYRTKVKAGLTGYAQIRGRYNTSAYDKLKMDLVYIVNYSLMEDLRLLLLTAKVLFLKESTAGFKRKPAKSAAGGKAAGNE